MYAEEGREGPWPSPTLFEENIYFSLSEKIQIINIKKDNRNKKTK